jgi:hypothetical protein
MILIGKMLWLFSQFDRKGFQLSSTDEMQFHFLSRLRGSHELYELIARKQLLVLKTCQNIVRSQSRLVGW